MMTHNDDRLTALLELDILDTLPEPEFDDIVRLASLYCETPVALVSLVEKDRQWFKARIGFDACETPLSQSVCAHAVAERRMLIIPDLATDPRTRHNTLVTEEPHIRFYAGAPLVTPDGHVLGTLCVIDQQPRPQGLTDNQIQVLEVLARQVMSQLAIRRVNAALASAEQRYRALFDAVTAGYCIIEMKFDEAMRPVDYRFVEVNAAFAAQTGLPDAAGKWMRDLAPEHEQHWFDIYGKVALTGEAVRFENPADQLGRWYDVQAFKVGKPEDRLVAILFNDITTRRNSELRQAALLGLGDGLREADTIKGIGGVVSTVLVDTLKATRAGYITIDLAGDTASVARDTVAPGAETVAGTYPLSLFADTLKRLSFDSPIAVANVPAAGWIAKDAESYKKIGVRAFIAVPLLHRDQLVGALFVHSGTPRTWTPEEIDFANAVADRTYAAVAKVQAEQEQRLLNEELSHRLKNTLAMVQAIAGQTLRKAEDKQAVQAFTGRLQALSSAHDILLQKSWASARMIDVVEGVIVRHGERSQFEIRGPNLTIGPKAVLSLSLLLHEMTTNAVKYGALSVPTGCVEILWQLSERSVDQELIFHWKETGGPVSIAPASKGFGSRLISIGLVGTARTDIRYTAEGLVAEFRAPLSLMTIL